MLAAMRMAISLLKLRIGFAIAASAPASLRWFFIVGYLKLILIRPLNIRG